MPIETLYRGVDVEHLSREELIEALKDVGRLYEQHLKGDIAHLDGLRARGINVMQEPFPVCYMSLSKHALGISRLDFDDLELR